MRCCCLQLGARHLQVALLFVSFLLVYCMRSSVSVAVVAMTDNSYNPDFPEYDWSSYEHGLVLSSFFWCYVLMQIPGGMLARKRGMANPLLCLTLIGSGGFAMLIPLAAHLGSWKFVAICRALQGIVEGWLYPTVHCMLAAWLPLEERGVLVMLTYSGSQLGMVTGMSVSGALAASALGWPSIFYLFGGLAVAWGGLCLFVSASSPEKSRFISDRELELIQKTTGKILKKEERQDRSIPWMSILRSPAVWGLVAAQCGDSWGFWILLTEIPTYMASILKFEISQNGLLSALPYLTMLLVLYISGFVSYCLQKYDTLSINASRKLFNSIGQYGASASLVAIALIPPDSPTVLVSLLAVTVGITGTMTVGYLPVHVDMSPNFAGVVMGMANCIANMLGIIGPLAVGAIVTENTYQEWQIVFFISAAVYFLCNTLFIIFGHAEVQPWNDTREKSHEEDNMIS